MSPDYPLRKPEQLLEAFAEDLRREDPAGDRSDAFSSQVRAFQDAAKRRPAGELADPSRSDFARVLRAFSGWIASLPRPVVLILDTCEELARLDPGGSPAPAIAATYRVLEWLHDRIDTLRVVFAGRRPLAASGAGDWRLHPTARKARPHLEHKWYLQLHLVRGFDRQEAEGYLAGHSLHVSGELREEIFARSRDSETITDLIAGLQPGPSASTPSISRFMRAGWERKGRRRWPRSSPAKSILTSAFASSIA